MVKWIAIGVTALAMVIGAIFFLEDRYHKIAAANEMNEATIEKIVLVKTEVSKEVLNTFKSVQRSFESMQRDNDTNHLESLKDRKYLLEQQSLIEPFNRLLQEKILVLDRQIKRLESKLCN